MKELRLTDLEYNVVMEAIGCAKNLIAEDEFIDPYNNEAGYTNEVLLKALESAENKIQRA